MQISIYDDMEWSDMMWVEDDKGWFVLASKNALFEMDLKTYTYKLITLLPDYALANWRNNPKCIKYGEKILCMPIYGDCIWEYNLDVEELVRIDVFANHQTPLYLSSYWIIGDILYTVSISLKQIIIIDLKTRNIIESVIITNREVELKQSIMVDNSLYVVSNKEAIVFEYNIIEKKITEHLLEGASVSLNTIVFDGDNLWLSGSRKEIYIWNRTSNKVRVINNFPIGFGKYIVKGALGKYLDCDSYDLGERAFAYGVNSSKYMWFIPYKTNKLLYIDKKTFQIYSLDIEDEVEIESSLYNRKVHDKFFLQFIDKDERMVLYSMKNKKFLEIDMNKLTWKYKNAELDMSKSKYIRRHKCVNDKRIVFKEAERAIFWAMICR